MKKDNNLLIKNPILCEEWGDKNEMGPENYTCGSGKKVFWVCKKCGNEWEATINHRNVGDGCPYCSGRCATKENNLLIKNPNLCEEWSKRNGSGPEKYTPNSSQRVWWKCKKCENEWKSIISNRTKGRGCPVCSCKAVSKDNNLLIKNPILCKEWGDKNEISPENYMPNSGKIVWWKCKKCKNEWKARIAGRNSNGKGCPYCSGQKASKENNLLVKNPELCEEWSYKNKSGPKNYTSGSNIKIWWKCRICNNEWKATIYDRNKGRGCPYCSGYKASKENNLLIKNPELCEEWSKKNKSSPENYTQNSGKKVFWICKKCENEWKATIASRNGGRGCPYCSGYKASKENNLLIKNPELCEEWSKKNKSGPENYTCGSEKKVWWICENNHEWKATVYARNKGNGCPLCCKSISKSSQLWLNSLNIHLIREYKIPYTNYKVDGYDPKTNICYEFYGDLFHSNPEVFNLNDFHPVISGKTHRYVFNRTKKRERVLKYLGYNLVIMWENDWKQNNKELKE